MPDTSAVKKGREEEEEEKEEAKPGLLICIWTSGLWKFFPFVLLYIIGIATLYPIVPTILTNGFASAAAGRHIECQDFTPEASPKECRHAHAQVVMWGSWTSFVSGSILSFLFSPITGHLSDHWGRKPFMLIGICLGVLPMLTIMVHVWGWITIYWYYPASALSGLVSSFSMVLTAVADVMRPEHRAASVAFITANFSIGLIIGPILGGYLDQQSAVYTCIGLTLLALLYVVVFVPECAPRKCKPADSAADVQPSQGPAYKAPGLHAVLPVDQTGEPPAKQQSSSEANQDLLVVCTVGTEAAGTDEPEAQKAHNTAGGSKSAAQAVAQAGHDRPSRASLLSSLSKGWSVMITSTWYIKLAIIWSLVTAMSSGAQDVLIQYLQMQLGFTTRDQAKMMVVAACCSLGVKITLLGLLIRYLGDQWVLALGLAAYVAEYLMLAVATTKVAALVAVGVGAMAAISWPAMIALQSSKADPKEWGAVAGVLQAVGSLASGMGPLLFAALFTEFSKTEPESPFPYCPQAVWYLAAALGTLATLVASTLHWGQPVKQQKQQNPREREAKPCAPASGTEEAGCRADEGGGSSGAGQKVDTWVISRALSMKSSLSRLGSFADKGRDEAGGSSTGSGAGGRGGRSRMRSALTDVEQPLLCEAAEEAHAEEEARALQQERG